MFAVSRYSLVCTASQAGNADFFRAPDLTSGFGESINVHSGTVQFVAQKLFTLSCGVNSTVSS